MSVYVSVHMASTVIHGMPFGGDHIKIRISVCTEATHIYI